MRRTSGVVRGLWGFVLSAVVTAPVASARPAGRKVTQEYPEDEFFPARFCEFVLVDSLQEGTCRAHDAMGRLVFAQEFVHGKLQADRVTYYPSGRKFGRSHVEDGLEDGADPARHRRRCRPAAGILSLAEG